MKIRPDKVASCPQIYCRCKCCRLFQKINIFVEKSLTNGPPFCILIVSNAERYRIDEQTRSEEIGVDKNGTRIRFSMVTFGIVCRAVFVFRTA